MLRISLVLLIPAFYAQDIIFSEPENTSFIHRRTTTVKEQEEVQCPSNMLFDSSENECECVPETVYYPPKDSCFNAFRQGPCEPGYYMAIPKNATVADCIQNVCGKNGTVPYKNSCHFLLTTGPCKSTESLQINENTMELECRKVGTATYQIIDAPRNGCLPGTRRIARGECRKLI